MNSIHTDSIYFRFDWGCPIQRDHAGQKANTEQSRTEPKPQPSRGSAGPEELTQPMRCPRLRRSVGAHLSMWRSEGSLASDADAMRSGRRCFSIGSLGMSHAGRVPGAGAPWEVRSPEKLACGVQASTQRFLAGRAERGEFRGPYLQAGPRLLLLLFFFFFSFCPELLERVPRSILKGQAMEGQGSWLQTSGCRNSLSLATVHHVGQVMRILYPFHETDVHWGSGKGPHSCSRARI